MSAVSLSSFRQRNSVLAASMAASMFIEVPRIYASAALVLIVLAAALIAAASVSGPGSIPNGDTDSLSQRVALPRRLPGRSVDSSQFYSPPQVPA